MHLKSTSFKTNWSYEAAIVLLLSLEVFTHLILCASASAPTIDENLALTYGQKVILGKFKERMSSKLPHDYMKTDIYLIRWLRAKNFNIAEAEEMLNENIKWRRDNKIDSIVEEKSSDIQDRFPYFIDTYAKNGEPIVTINFGDWDIREVVISGRMQQVIRQYFRLYEEVSTLIRKMQSEGKQVTQFYLIANMEGYNIISHGCFSCLPFYLTITDAIQNYYYGMTRSVIILNTPPAFGMILQALRPVMNSRTSRILKVYGQDKRTWKSALLQIADENQLAGDYGGTFVRKLEY